MWQFYALGALIFEAGEEIVDKIVIVGHLTMDTLVATFYRNLAYFIIAIVVGWSGVLGSMTLLITWPIVLVGLLFVGSAIFYTYLLKRIELTGSSALGYSRPVVFLVVDVMVLHAAFTNSQIIGVVLLVLGGLLFVINPLTRQLKPEYTKYVWLIFLYETFSYAAEFYVFKYYINHNLNEISYIFSTNLVNMIGLGILTVWQGNWKSVKNLVTKDHYMLKMFLSKTFDFLYVVFLYKAMKTATVSQVSATEAFYPLILITGLYIIQHVFKFRAGEKFDRINLVQKTLGTAVLVLGIWLAS